VIGIIAGTGFVIAAGTTLAVDHAHHTLKGCVSTGLNGLQLEKDSNKRTYTLAGKTADVRAGDIVRLHGTRVKKHKDNPGNPEFLVEKVTKDYGPCKVLTASATTTPTSTKN
jgi:hypothetical protein